MKKIVIMTSLIMVCLTLLVGCETKNEDKLNEEANKENENINTEGNATNITSDLPKGVKAIIYLDPTDLSKECNAENSVSTTGTKSGCMKWYAYKETSSTYTMILDHNTTATVPWNSSGSNNDGMNEVKTTLESDTTGWIGNPRLITGGEIADITGNTSWTISSGWFYFDTNTASYSKEGKYYWLYDYTYDCVKLGCNIEDSSNFGYWTSDSYSLSSAWAIDAAGFLNNVSVNNKFYGVRPVIEVSKSELQ